MLLLGALIWLLSSANNMVTEMCENRTVRIVPSPDERLKAVVFERICSSTDGTSTQVSILPAEKELPNRSGNLFIAQEPPAVVRVDLVWSAPRKVTFAHRGKRITRQVDRLDDIRITYRLGGMM